MATSALPETFSCPFCHLIDENLEFLIQHINLVHPEDDDAPYLLQTGEQRSTHDPLAMEGAASGKEYVDCACGEACLVSEFANHLDLHEAENIDNIATEATSDPLPPESSSKYFLECPATAAAMETTPNMLPLVPNSNMLDLDHRPLLSDSVKSVIQGLNSIPSSSFQSSPLAKRLGVRSALDVSVFAHH